MGDESPEADASGSAYLQEVARLLRGPGSTFLCITLAQQHVLRKH